MLLSTLYLCTAAAANRHLTTYPAASSQHSEQAVSRREAFLQLSSTAVLGSLGIVLGSQSLCTPAQPAWAAGEPQELTGSVKAAVDKALDKYVVKCKVSNICMHACMHASPPMCGCRLCPLLLDHG